MTPSIQGLEGVTHLNGVPLSRVGLVLLLVSLLVSSCGAGEGRSKATSVRLPPDVYIIPAKYMRAMCTIVDPEGNVLHEEKPCPDYRTPPAELIARFEARLPELLKAKDHEHLLPVLRDYLRQYWAVHRDGELYIEGQLVCRSHAISLTDDHDIVPSPPEELARVRIIIDDAGRCLVRASFPAERPERVEFDHD